MSDTLKNFFLVLILISLCFLIKCKLDADKAAEQEVTSMSSFPKSDPKIELERNDHDEDTSHTDDQTGQSSESTASVVKSHEKDITSTKTITEAPKKTPPVVKKNKAKPKRKPVKKTPKPIAKIEFDEMRWDFGEITEGDIIKKKFKFTNTGNAPLQIIGADASCGCARPTVPFLDIAPGESSEIGITYNSVNKDGDQEPEIIIESNTYPKHNVLKLFGTVKPKPETKEKLDSLKITQDSTVKN